MHKDWVKIAKELSPLMGEARKSSPEAWGGFAALAKAATAPGALNNLSLIGNNDSPLGAIPISSNDEIGEVIRSFNRLLALLAKREAELRDSEFRSKFAIDGAGDGLWDWNVPQKTVFLSKRWKEMLGYEDVDIGNKLDEWSGRVHPDDMPQVMADIQRHFDGATPTYINQHRLFCKDGSWKWVLDRGLVVCRDGVGMPLRVIGTHIDITDRKKIETDLAIAKETADAALRSKEDFLAMMSHELRTPMTGVIGMGEFLSETDLSTDQRSYVQTLISSAKTMMAVLNDILDYSKIEANAITIESIDFDVIVIINDVIRLFSYISENSSCKVVTVLGGVDSFIVKGDPTRVKQVLANLVGNAIKFSQNRSVVVRFGYKDDGDCRRLTFEVEDTGIGILEADMGRLFLPFSQADTGTTRKFGGTGLGLSICKRLVELMDGEISATSQFGKGSLFRFTCLVKHGSQERIPTKTLKAKSVSPMNILVAEDNPINRAIVRIGLEKRHHRVTLVENGLKACEAAAVQCFDVILMDMQMPVMDGDKAAKHIRSLPAPFCNVPIVALTADAILEHRGFHMNAGLNGYLTKPIVWNELDVVLSRLNIEKVAGPEEAIADIAFLQSDDTNIQLLDLTRVENIKDSMPLETFRHLIDILAQCAEEEKSRLREALRINEMSLIKRIAHGLKGMFVNIGCDRVVALLKQLQECNDIEAADALCKIIVVTVDESVAELKTLCACLSDKSHEPGRVVHEAVPGDR